MKEKSSVALVNPRTGRTLENIANSIGTHSVRCGGCCWAAQPCGQCVLLTKLANWHSAKDGHRWEKELAVLKSQRTSDDSGTTTLR